MQAVSNDDDEKIRQIATVKDHSKTLYISSDELVAKEAKCHISCYKDYKCPDKHLAGSNDAIKTEILRNVVKELPEKSDDKIVIKTKYMRYLENNDIDFKNASKYLKLSIEQNFSNIKLLTLNNNDIIYPDCSRFEDVLELYLRIKEKLRKYENMNEVQQSVVSSTNCIRNELQKSSYQIPSTLKEKQTKKNDDLDVKTFPEIPLLQEFLVRLISNEPSPKSDR